MAQSTDLNLESYDKIALQSEYSAYLDHCDLGLETTHRIQTAFPTLNQLLTSSKEEIARALTQEPGDENWVLDPRAKAAASTVRKKLSWLRDSPRRLTPEAVQVKLNYLRDILPCDVTNILRSILECRARSRLCSDNGLSDEDDEYSSDEEKEAREDLKAVLRKVDYFKDRPVDMGKVLAEVRIERSASPRRKSNRRRKMQPTLYKSTLVKAAMLTGRG